MSAKVRQTVAVIGTEKSRPADFRSRFNVSGLVFPYPNFRRRAAFPPAPLSRANRFKCAAPAGSLSNRSKQREPVSPVPFKVQGSKFKVQSSPLPFLCGLLFNPADPILPIHHSTTNHSTMKITKPLLLALHLSLITLLSACATQPPPSALEQKLFNVQTNYIPVVLLQTNIVLATNYVADPAAPEAGAPLPVIVTNYVFVPATNLAPQYAFSPNTNAAAIAQAAGSVGDFWGVGGIAGTAAGALFSLWAWVRNRQAGLTAATLAQVVETGRQLLLSLPHGEQYDDAWKSWIDPAPGPGRRHPADRQNRRQRRRHRLRPRRRAGDRRPHRVADRRQTLTQRRRDAETQGTRP